MDRIFRKDEEKTINWIRRFFGFQATQYVCIALLAVCYALVCEIFIFPNQFAPAGVVGIITIAQYLMGRK